MHHICKLFCINAVLMYRNVCVCVPDDSVNHYNALLLFSGQTGRPKVNRKEGLSANSSQFTLGGEAFRLLGGSLHYFRVPRAYWRDRMMKMKACGINTLTT